MLAPVSRVLVPVSRVLIPVSRVLVPVSRVLVPVNRVLVPVSRVYRTPVHRPKESTGSDWLVRPASEAQAVTMDLASVLSVSQLNIVYQARAERGLFTN